MPTPGRRTDKHWEYLAFLSAMFLLNKGLFLGIVKPNVHY